ncbi:dTMP kinase [Solihabitans fulvus]|uniref:Thymidylate kinase n=1 Tax=Solihabitans fulvus TaxID=1892852 RepID=A0A5B2XEA2_9PSEU|nr:dTMP kinase [Solihabitans fulvus]KAA2261102.1 dTMP kinase [Solihabitans fulvus]
MSEKYGLFITLDGPSGVGKTTVSALLAEKLAPHSSGIVLTTTPSKSNIGELARRSTYDLHGLALTCLVAADRYHHEQTTVRPALEAGKVVVCDRYAPTSLVLDPQDGVDIAFVRSLYRCIRLPDIAFILIGDPALCAERTARRGTYSRFQPTSPADSTREVEGFKAVTAELVADGYPIHLHNVHDATADHVADVLLKVIFEANEGGL